jgi:cytochrome c553
MRRARLHDFLAAPTALLFGCAVVWSAHAAEPAAAAKPDIAKGQKIATQVCASCHAADGNSVMPTNPRLAGQHAEYLVKQLTNFKPANGKPAERNNVVMGGMASTLSSAEEIRDVAAYFASQKAKPGAAKDRDLVVIGEKLYRGGNAATGVPACASCHGPGGAGIPAQYPRIAGQFAEYAETQLKAFRSGERANDPQKMMRTIAARMSDLEIRAVSDYIAGLR